MSLTKVILVPLFMFLSSALMATAWLGHLRFRDQIGFWTALGASWLLVLPEYILNVAATRFGYGTFVARRWPRSTFPSVWCASHLCPTLCSTNGFRSLRY
jgi:uncharacterized protein (DUF486 family)